MTQVIVVYGEAGCGKTTFVRDHIKDNDIVFDYDAMFSAISFKPQRSVARDCQFRMLMDLRRIFLMNMQRCGADNVYVIVVDPEKIKTFIPRDAKYIHPTGGKNAD